LLVNGWRGVQAIFSALSALLVPLAASLAWSLWGRRDYAIAAGLLTLFSGHYTGYWGSAPDSFGPFALAVTGAILAAADERWLLAGVATGFAALTRGDGLLIGLVVGGQAIYKRNWRGAGLLAAACLLILAPWWARNWLVAGTPWPGGGLKTLWLVQYEELFSPGQELSLPRYLAQGLGPLLRAKAEAGLYNAYLLLGGWPYLGGFALAGCWQRRCEPRVRLALLYAAALWLGMTLGFTLPAQHGSTFHSASALVIWQAACVPAGIAVVTGWLKRWLKWDAARYTRYLLVRLVGLAVVVSLAQYGLIWLRIIRPELTGHGWINHGHDPYVAVGQWLDEQNAPATQPVIVRDPPSFFGVTGRFAIMLPHDLSFLDRAADRYGARCTVMEEAGIGRFRAGSLAGWQEMWSAGRIALFCRTAEERKALVEESQAR
jgi:hypothetical protein